MEYPIGGGGNDLPGLAEWRESRGLPADPMAAFAASGYQEHINAERQGGHQAGWGA